MSANKIMIIRHAEKPDDAGGVSGVTLQGLQDTEDLTPRGWQRSGVLVRFFAPLEQGFGSALLSLPDSIFASAVASHSKSLRPQHTDRCRMGDGGPKPSQSARQASFEGTLMCLQQSG